LDSGETVYPEWEGLNEDKNFDIEYLRKLAQKTPYGRKRMNDYFALSAVKKVMTMLQGTDPNFGDHDVAKIMKQTLGVYVFDARCKPSERYKHLYKLNDGGIYEVEFMDSLKLYLGNKILWILNNRLKPAVLDRITQLEAVMEEVGDESFKKMKECSELITLKGAGKMKGFTGHLAHMISELHMMAPRTRIVTAFYSEVQQVKPPLAEQWNDQGVLEFLFPFKNGVIDLSTFTFRPGNASEYILKTCGRNYKPSTLEKRNEVMRELCNMYANDDQLMIKLISIAAALRGRNVFQQFLFDTGSGGNGKGTLWALVNAVFGELAGTIEPEVLQNVQPKPDAATSYLVLLRYCRIVTCADPEAEQALKMSFIKRISGGDAISARGLYQNTFLFIAQFYIWMQTNTMPPVDTLGATQTDRRAVDRRLVVTQAPFDFGGSDVHSPTYKQGDINLRTRFENDTETHDAFFDILLSVYKLYCVPIFEAGKKKDASGKETGVTQIRDIGKLGTGTEHLGVKYPQYWEDILEQYKGKTDTLASYLNHYYVKTLPDGFRQKDTYFDIEAHGAKKMLMTATKDYIESFESNLHRETVLDLVKHYKEYVEVKFGKKQKTESSKHVVQRMTSMGYGLTKDINGREIFFGLRSKSNDDEEKSETVENPFTNKDRPNVGPDSHVDRIINCKPLEQMESLEQEGLDDEIEDESVMRHLNVDDMMGEPGGDDGDGGDDGEDNLDYFEGDDPDDHGEKTDIGRTGHGGRLEDKLDAAAMEGMMGMGTPAPTGSDDGSSDDDGGDDDGGDDDEEVNEFDVNEFDVI
jgi:phage/plasmid-associated DNA primase